MSRARDIADFNASLFADDEISGDKVSGGTIGAGTFNGTIGSSATFPAGTVLQTQMVGFSGIQTIGNGSSTGTTFVNIGSGVSGQEFSISMSVSSGNKILGFGTINLTASNLYSGIKAFSDSDQIALADADGNRTRLLAGSTWDLGSAQKDFINAIISFSFSHSPSDTSSHTYTIQAGNNYSASTQTFINRFANDGNLNYVQRSFSHLTLMEIGI